MTVLRGPEERGKPGVHISSIMSTQGFIADRADQVVQTALLGGPALGRIENLGVGLAQEHHFGERPGAGERFLDRARARRAEN